MRWMRLGLGIVITVQSIYIHEIAMIAIGVLFTSMAVLNIGCCGVGGCTIPNRKNSVSTKDTDNKEIV
jgi:hypothetical protein